MEDDRIEVK